MSSLALQTPEAELRTQLCPWCSQPISHDKFVEIQAAIADQERQKLAEVRAEIEAQSVARIEAADRAAAAELAAQKATAEAAIAAVKTAAAKEVAATKVEAAKALAEASASAYATHEAAFKEKLVDATTARQAAETKLAAADQDREQALAEQRRVLLSDKDDALNRERAEYSRKEQKLQERVLGLQRDLDAQKSAAIGEGADVNLYDELRTAFPNDKIVMVKAGQPGANIEHVVIENGRTCGTIVYDSKPHTTWRTAYVGVLRKDMLTLNADHAVLATRFLPVGHSQIAIVEGIVVANPARVVPIVHMLRTGIIAAATLRLTNEERHAKAAQLYDYITSEAFRQKLREMDRLALALQRIDADEKTAHDAVWKRRGEVMLSLYHTQQSLALALDDITTRTDGEPAK